MGKECYESVGIGKKIKKIMANQFLVYTSVGACFCIAVGVIMVLRACLRK
jgi:hypothetical protein